MSWRNGSELNMTIFPNIVPHEKYRATMRNNVMSATRSYIKIKEVEDKEKPEMNDKAKNKQL